ncbi:hypothetical protein D8M04_13770 [Oceanobacillus piezotolerans]|uniref:Phenylalanyl-tRNA synthetase subunit beta n=1 Tax=Oceanobacillus piezotolerans TaxID=2448030 RepID=A0A498D9U1_9BACI|nr:hypothetical protein [Oceanobacillus piezotolerans]RLL43957.1 hypothetical protein D8M04_13770 [Oceanobacillus piezotolerans]
MRLKLYILIVIMALAVLGYGIYYTGTQAASDKLMEALSTELIESGEMENIKQTIESDPELKVFLDDDSKSVDESKLPFTTKEEATRAVVNKIGIPKLQDMQSKVQQGQMTKEDLIQEAERNFTEEEIAALKVIAYKELYNK